MTKTPRRTLTEKTGESDCGESGSQTGEEEHQFEFGGSCDELARFDKINSKLDKFLTAFGEIEVLREQICGLKET